MERVALHKRVIGLDIHQAQITACALIVEADGSTRICAGSDCLDTVLQLRPPFQRHEPDGLRGVT
ncbi:MAG: hypothetical protein WBI41_10870 [Azovibrio sp.]|uniref:hypothetical protein n=1 Tax=Azovibrio sp. TaxID=1872673 RepID=UPI003C74EFE3